MKSEKGVTLISLVVYVMSFLVIASIVALISSFYFSNTKVLSSEATATIEFDMLNVYLIKETKQYENWIIDLEEKKIEQTDENGNKYNEIEKKIVFSNGSEYIFTKENEKDEYGKIIYSNYGKYFVLCNYIEDFKLPELDNEETTEEIEGGILPLEEFEITVKILGKEYTQSYIIEQ